MADLKSALQAELAILQSELAKDPRYRKLVKIRGLLAEYDKLSPSPVTQASPLNPRGQPKSLTTQILNAASAYLQQTGRRAATSELTLACVKAGVPLPGDTQRQRDYVSSILSHSPAFNNVRGEGYGLADWPTEPLAKSTGLAAVDLPEELGAPNLEDQQQRLLTPTANGHYGESL